jgi:hypothetical protein
MSFRKTSPEDKSYNCIGWAAEDDSRWWWPDTLGISYWPEAIERREDIKTFALAYSSIGYRICDNERAEKGFQKVALYADHFQKPTHAARQLDNGLWTSKLGESFDIVHPFIREWTNIFIGDTYFDLANYGRLAAIFKRLKF